MHRMAFLAPVLLATGCATAHQTAHTGLHFQGDIGFGVQRSSASQGGDDYTISGSGGVFSLALGGAVVPNLIIGGQLWGNTTPDPTAEVNGQSIPTASNASTATYAFGPMVKYYFMPINFYLAATPSFAKLSSSSDTGSGETKWGPALRLAAGKEWYASQHWGLGIAGVLNFGSNEETEGGPTWSSVGGGVVFSASYN